LFKFRNVQILNVNKCSDLKRKYKQKKTYFLKKKRKNRKKRKRKGKNTSPDVGLRPS
jgi:hypothetical protein